MLTRPLGLTNFLAPWPESAADLTRRGLLGGGLAATALALAACGEGPVRTRNDARDTNPFDGDFGQVDVPVSPQRVVTTYTDTLDLAVALGLPVVGAPGARGDARNPFPPFLDQAALARAERISTYPEVNIEEIAALRPDLILDSFGDEAVYGKLSRLAPTMSIAPVEQQLSWQEVLSRIAEPLDRSERARSVIDQRKARAEEVRGVIAAGPFAQAVVAAGYGGQDRFSLYGADIPPCPVLIELDLSLVPDAPKKGAREYSQDLSLELLGLLEPAQAIFVTGDPAEGGFEPDRRAQTGLRSSPTWKTLPAVETGNVFDFPVDLAFAGPASDLALLDLLEQALGA